MNLNDLLARFAFAESSAKPAAVKVQDDAK
jgi:hypothetical protein